MLAELVCLCVHIPSETCEAEQAGRDEYVQQIGSIEVICLVQRACEDTSQEENLMVTHKLPLFVSRLLLFTSFGLFTIAHADTLNAYSESTKP